ncbi:MAG: FKBP-type peptidyl-prolyl cis-trans isomerase [Proteobacteria bacterium]|nr:MAG: FKBP-type peptidyl-prolyl cis-trans isomerase [Pseudomonadota bacterium]QKK11623.1 MAG: FKBP-type peptidyl-prolyl cis-trans isomerase [Pseudomonadota bacterium]
MRYPLLGAALLLLAATPAQAAEVTELTTQQQKLGYTIGLQIGQGLKRDGLNLDADALAQAVKDVYAGRSSRLTAEERQAVLQVVREEQNKKQAAAAVSAMETGKKFLAENAKKEGVTQTPSGLQYKVIKAGAGKQPTKDDTVVAHYRGTLINGTEFDSSFTRGEPASFPVGGVIPGWQEVLQLMKEGARWQVFIPSELAYAERGAGDVIGPNETLIFEIELLTVK